MRNRIYITDADCERLRRLIAGRRGANAVDHEYLDMLEQELDRAEIVEPNAIPRDVVTMNSEVRLKDLDSGEMPEKFAGHVGPGTRLDKLAIGTLCTLIFERADKAARRACGCSASRSVRVRSPSTSWASRRSCEIRRSRRCPTPRRTWPAEQPRRRPRAPRHTGCASSRA